MDVMGDAHLEGGGTCVCYRVMHIGGGGGRGGGSRPGVIPTLGWLYCPAAHPLGEGG